MTSRSEQVRRAAEAHFDRWALSYDRSWLNELVFFPTIRVVQEEIARWQQLTGRRSFRLLDVGCGTGTLLTLTAAWPDAELAVGLDYSAEMLRRVADKAQSSPPGGKLHAVRGDAERLPFADGSFDVVTCCNSFHHYPHHPAALAGFWRVLRPDGVLILVDGFRDNVVGWVIFDVIVAGIEGHVHHAAWSAVRDMLRAASFTALRQRKVGVLAPLLVSVARR